jgi:hypothetical protein
MARSRVNGVAVVMLGLAPAAAVAAGAEGDIASFPADPHWLVLLLIAAIAVLLVIGFLLPAQAWQDSRMLRPLAGFFGHRPRAPSADAPPDSTDRRPGSGASGNW